MHAGLHCRIAIRGHSSCVCDATKPRFRRIGTKNVIGDILVNENECEEDENE